MKKAIIGNGGFGREVYWSLSPSDRLRAVFFVDDSYYDSSQEKTFPLSKFNSKEYQVVVAIGDPQSRESLVKKLPNDTVFFTHIHPSSIILDDKIEIGEGSIICSGVILTTNIKIGKHCHLNLQTTIGHDTNIGDYFTTAPGVKISGNCNIGNKVYFGTNSCSKQKINICDNTTIGLNCGVVKNIYEPGIYIGTPAIKINHG